MKDRALVVAPLSACVGEGRDEVRGEGWNGLHSVHLSCSRNCRDLNQNGEGSGVRLLLGRGGEISPVSGLALLQMVMA